MPTDEAYAEVLRRLEDHDQRLSHLETRGEAMAGEQVEEVSGEIAGQKFTLKSLSLNTLLTLLGVIGVVVCCVLLYTHLGDSKDANAAFVGAIKDLTAAQKEQTSVAREGNCWSYLNTLPQDRRDPTLCQRISR